MIELIDSFIRPLHEHGIPYFITGSVASMAYGEPRLTNDIDVVIDLAADGVPKLALAFPEEDFYLPPPEVIQTELARGVRGHMNVISQQSLLKADFYFVGKDSIQRWGFKEARTIEIDNLPISIAPPEYVIIRKLEFYREGQSQKHLRDISSMLAESSDEIDFKILTDHISRLNLQSEWLAAQSAAR